MRMTCIRVCGLKVSLIKSLKQTCSIYEIFLMFLADDSSVEFVGFVAVYCILL